MDYVKYLGLTVAAAVSILLAGQTGVGILMFIVAGLTIGGFIMKSPVRYSAGYILWLATVCLWGAAVLWLLHECVDPVKCTPQSVRVAEGFWLLVGMILLHPISYGLGRLIAPVFGKPLPDSEKPKPGSKIFRRRRRLIWEFAAIVLCVLGGGWIAGSLMGDGGNNLETYIIMCALLLGAAWLVKRLRFDNPVSGEPVSALKPIPQPDSQFARVIAETKSDMKQKKPERSEAEKNLWRRPE